MARSLTLWFEFAFEWGGWLVLNLDSVFRCWVSMMIRHDTSERILCESEIVCDAFCCWFWRYMGTSSRRWVELDATHHTFTRNPTESELRHHTHQQYRFIFFFNFPMLSRDFFFRIFQTMLTFFPCSTCVIRPTALYSYGWLAFKSM